MVRGNTYNTWCQGCLYAALTFLEHVNLLHGNITLYTIMAGGWFFNPGKDPVCPNREISMWTFLQGYRWVWIRMSTVDLDISTVDGRNSHTNHIPCASKVHWQVISDSRILQQEIRTKPYIMYSIFGYIGLHVEALGMEVVNHVDFKYSTFKR